MKAKNIPKIVLMALMLVLATSIAYAAECSGTFSGPSVNVYTGEQFTLNYFNAEAASGGENLTLVLPANVDNYTSLVIGPVAPFNAYSWDVAATVDGDYSFVALLSGIDCNKTFNVTVHDNVSDPNLSVSMNDVDTVVIDTAFDYDVTLTNAGPGVAADVVGIAYTASGTPVTPATFAITSIGNESGSNTNVASYSVAPASCGSDSFTALVQNYEDTSGENMGSVSGNDSFTVIGTDLGFVSFTPSASSAIQGESVTFNANIRNVGTMNASSATVSFARDGTPVGDVSLTDLGINESTGAINTFAIPSDFAPGNYTISAQITAPNECVATNNDASFTFEVVQGTCGDGITNNGEACDGGSNCNSDCTVRQNTGGGGGGGSSNTNAFDLTLTPDLPSASLTAARYDTVRLHYEGRTYTFRFRSVFTDSIRIELVRPSTRAELNIGDTVEFDLDEDGENDVSVELLGIESRRADVKFTLIGYESSGRQPVGIIDAPAPRSRDRVVISEPVTSGPGDDEPEEESLLRGFITFVENFAVKDKIPVWAGALLALLLVVVIAGAYLFFTRDN